LASASAATYIITDRSVNPSIARLARLTTRRLNPDQLLHPGQFIGEQVQRGCARLRPGPRPAACQALLLASLMMQVLAWSNG
jgi:hypothetical protein